MAEAVYILCSVTSITCAVLLLKGYFNSGARLLLWSGLCFVGLALNNSILFFDIVIYPQGNLSLWRIIPAGAGLLVLIYGLIWDSV
jgi:hypothetical protein